MKWIVGDFKDVTADRLGINGEGIATLNRMVIFVPNLLPGERAKIEITRVEKNYAEGRVVKRDNDSKDRVKAPCPIYDECGGCQIQHMSARLQMEYKEEIVRNAFRQKTKLNVDKSDIRSTIGMEDPWYYRNKSQFPLGTRRGEIVSGLYKPNSNHLVPIEHCMVQQRDTTNINNAIVRILNELDIPVYDARRDTGFARTIVVRSGYKTNDVQVVLVVGHEDVPDLDELSDRIMELPNVVSFHLNINANRSGVIFGYRTMHIAGQAKMDEQLDDVHYHLSPRAFFQLNPAQTEKMYREVVEAAGLTGEERVIDAYAGVGSIGLWLAPHAKEIRGMEVVPEAVADANDHMRENGYAHVTYVEGRAEHWIPRWVKDGWIPDVVVVDPPRTGMDHQLINSIISSKTKRIVYVSCNPQTLARDADQLMKAGYKVNYIQPYDMFPQTSHVESIVVFEKKKKKKF